MASVSYQGVSRYYHPGAVPAVDSLDLHINDGEFLVLVGPSGCGKTTTLRMLAGLEPVDEGTISIGHKDVTHIPPSQRDISMVFQNYALYPHMTVRENISFPLRMKKYSPQEIRQRVDDATRMLDLTELLDRKPAKLSGGQRQRVAMGRAIVNSPQVFLMDEPLSNLDAKLRTQTRTHIVDLQRRMNTTTVYVTHDQVEAMTMGDRVAILSQGVLQQVDTPTTVYTQPHNIFVAGFIGSPAMNLLSTQIVKEDDGSAYAIISGKKLSIPTSVLPQLSSTTIIVGIRPEKVHIATQGMAVTVEEVEELGADSYLYCRGEYTSINPETIQPTDRPFVVRTPGLTSIRRGERIYVDWELEHTSFFDPHTQLRLTSE